MILHNFTILTKLQICNIIENDFLVQKKKEKKKSYKKSNFINFHFEQYKMQTFIYYSLFINLFIYLFICLFINLFIYS